MGSAASRPRQIIPKSLSHPPSAAPKPVVDDPPNQNLLSHLAQLGQVRVQNPAVDIPVDAFRTTPSTSSLLRTTTTTSTTKPTPSSYPFAQPRNTLSPAALTALLDSLKSDQHAPTLAHAKQLVQQLNLDWDVYQRLAIYVNSPSIGRQKEIQSSDNSRRVLREAIWVDPAYTRASRP